MLVSVKASSTYMTAICWAAGRCDKFNLPMGSENYISLESLKESEICHLSEEASMLVVSCSSSITKDLTESSDGILIPVKPTITAIAPM